MKVTASVLMTVVFACLLAGCASGAVQPGDTVEAELIQPGEKVGGMLIDQGNEDDVTYIWELDCKQKAPPAEIYDCKADLGTKVVITPGVYSPELDLEKKWSEFTYELSFGDRPVNLEAFGTIDTMHPRAGPMRHYNVVVSSDQPGSINFNEKYQFTGEKAEESRYTLTFEAEK